MASATIADITALERSIATEPAPPATLPPPLRALWHAKKGGLAPSSASFTLALTVVTAEAHGHPAETNLAWVHALLRRAAEHHANIAAAPTPPPADEGSAARWYGVAGRPIPDDTFAVEDEWRAIASTLLGEVLQNGAAGPDAMEQVRFLLL